MFPFSSNIIVSNNLWWSQNRLVKIYIQIYSYSVFLFSSCHRPLSDFSIFWQMAWYSDDLHDIIILKCMGNCYNYYFKSGKIRKMSWTLWVPARTLPYCYANMVNPSWSTNYYSIFFHLSTKWYCCYWCDPLETSIKRRPWNIH